MVLAAVVAVVLLMMRCCRCSDAAGTDADVVAAATVGAGAGVVAAVGVVIVAGAAAIAAAGCFGFGSGHGLTFLPSTDGYGCGSQPTTTSDSEVNRIVGVFELSSRSLLTVTCSFLLDCDRRTIVGNTCGPLKKRSPLSKVSCKR